MLYDGFAFLEEDITEGEDSRRLRYIWENDGASLYKNRRKYITWLLIIVQFGIVALVTKLFVEFLVINNWAINSISTNVYICRVINTRVFYFLNRRQGGI